MRASSLLPSRLARLTLGFSIVASLVCTGTLGAHAANRAAAPITLKFASWDPADVTTRYLQLCEQKLHLKVVNLFIPVANYETKIETEMAARTAPDVFYGSEGPTMTWGADGQILNQVPYREKLHAPLSDVFPFSLWWNHGQVGGQLLGQGVAVEDFYLFYNKNNFAAAGVAPPPSDVAHAWTWDQFVAVARKLTIDRHGKHPGQAGFDPKHILRYGVSIPDWWAPLLVFVYSNGGSPFDSSYTHFTLNQPAAAAAVQAIADLALKDHVAPTPVQLVSGAGSLTLASGRVAMVIDGNWRVYFDQHPTKTYPMGIGVLPKFKTYRTVAIGAPLVVWARTQHPLEATAMAVCIARNSQPLWRNGIWLPTVKSAYTPAALKTWITPDVHPSNFKSVAIDPLFGDHVAVIPPEIKTAQFTPAWNDVVQPAIDEILSGHKSAQSALNAIKGRVDAMLARGR